MDSHAVKELIEKRMATAVQQLATAYHGGILTEKFALQGVLLLVGHTEILRDIARVDQERVRARQRPMEVQDQPEGAFTG